MPTGAFLRAWPAGNASFSPMTDAGSNRPLLVSFIALQAYFGRVSGQNREKG